MLKINRKSILQMIVGVIIGAGLTLLSVHIFIKSDVQKAKDQIISQYTANDFEMSPKQCSNLSQDETVPKNSILSIAEVKKKIRVNKLVNRAIIVGCGETEALLAKAPDGTWLETQIQLTYGTRVNPTWQKACLIQDITTADTVVRPENGGIDANNLKECKVLNQVYDLKLDVNGPNPDNPFKLVPLN